MVRARELRFVFVVDDYEAAARLYRDVFGLRVVMDLEGDGGRGVILKIPRPPSSWPTSSMVGSSTRSRSAALWTIGSGSPSPWMIWPTRVMP